MEYINVSSRGDFLFIVACLIKGYTPN